MTLLEQTPPVEWQGGHEGSWTEERAEIVRSMWADGKSASQIAAALGNVTRNAVCGKIDRMGLTRRGLMAPKIRRVSFRGVKAPRRVKPRKGGARSMFATDFTGEREQGSTASRIERETKAAERRARFEAFEIVDLPPEQSATAVPLLKLTDTSCRWPLGDPRDLKAMRFCGAYHYEGRPYCLRHCKMAYRARESA